MEKVLVITYYWPPSGGAGVQRILKFVKYFPQSGIKPFVLTVKEDKASYSVIDKTLLNDIPAEAEIFRTDTFEPYDYYSKLLGKKSIPTGFSNESSPGLFQKFSRFIRGNFFIPDGRKGWIKFAFREACRIIERESIKTVITSSPPHSVQIVGLKLKKKYDINWIADLRDPWTDIYYYNEFNHLKFAKKIDSDYEKEVLEKADKIITVGKSLKNLFAGKSKKIDPAKIHVISNGFDEDDFKLKGNTKTTSDDEFIITYTGTLAESYKPEVFFKALEKVRDKYSDVKFSLRFIGNPATSIIEKIKNSSLENNLVLIPTVTHEKSVEYLLSSTVLLLVIPEIKDDKGILTGKLFEYLGSQKPVICIGPSDGDAADIINECEAGKTFERNMETEIADYIEELVQNRKLNMDIDIKNNCFKKYSRQSQTKEISEIIYKLKSNLKK
ncbi:MAG TPA: glycosyltransferase family 4 protein [Ignavibacteria bacterium]|nr:glycosyltransferase family 4 protein [Ignavibacteria bacterium]